MMFSENEDIDRVDLMISRFPQPIKLPLAKQKVGAALVLLSLLWACSLVMIFERVSIELRMPVILLSVILPFPLFFAIAAIVFAEKNFVELNENGFTVSTAFSSRTYPWECVDRFSPLVNPFSLAIESHDRKDVGVKFRWRGDSQGPSSGGITRVISGSYDLHPSALVRLLAGWKIRACERTH